MVSAQEEKFLEDIEEKVNFLGTTYIRVKSVTTAKYTGDSYDHKLRISLLNSNGNETLHTIDTLTSHLPKAPLKDTATGLGYALQKRFESREGQLNLYPEKSSKKEYILALHVMVHFKK